MRYGKCIQNRWGVLAGLLVSGGCVTQPRQPPLLPDRPPAVPAAPVVDLSMPDLSPLAGARICLDPGHSVEHPGATAPANGLEEATLNLRVALRVRELLEGAGATVLMTRTDERGLDPSSTARDLALRTEFANARDTDVFVSIHHNADIVSNSMNNDLEVYYKLTDDGPSLDLAQRLISSLARRVRQDAAAKRLLPGNYKVLRLTDAPAVLLETSYLTHAGNAQFMATDKGVEAEALAIADGLAAYFALKPLRVGPPRAVPQPGMPERLEIVVSDPTAVVLAATRVLVDGEEVVGHASLAQNILRWQLGAPLANGEHDLTVYVQNVLGAWSRTTSRLSVMRDPAAIFVRQDPERVFPESGQQAALRAYVLDAFGLAVADGTVVKLLSGAEAVTRDGLASFYTTLPHDGRFVCSAGDVTATHQLVMGDQILAAVTLRDAHSNAPIAGATVSGGAAAVSDTNGWLTLAPGNYAVSAKGYEETRTTLRPGHQDLALTPRNGGVLLGKTIMIDPAHGGRMPGLAGPDGTRASDLNLIVARRLAERLRDAGATPVLTRAGDREISDVERVRLENEVAPDLFVRITFGDSSAAARVVDTTGKLIAPGTAYVAHYPGSTQGMRLARAIADALPVPLVVPCYHYVVQQVGAPAVVVQAAEVSHGVSYRTEVDALWHIADSIYRGIAHHLTLD